MLEAYDSGVGETMIHELRQYTFKPGRLGEYLELARTVGRPARGNEYGVNLGYWTPEFGSLNQIWHIWSYSSLDERTRLRAALAQNKAWTTEYVPRIRPLIERQDIRFMRPVKDVAPPPGEGNIYELRIYRTAVGETDALADLYRAIMPVREKYSPCVGMWVGECPQPNELLHLYAYPSLDARAATRAALFKDVDWIGHVQSITPMILDMQSTVLIPTAYSTMR